MVWNLLQVRADKVDRVIVETIGHIEGRTGENENKCLSDSKGKITI